MKKCIVETRNKVEPSTFKKPTLTDQKFHRQSDINNIVAEYGRTKELPSSSSLLQYLDNTNLPSLEESFEIVRAANEQFMQLPSRIRKLMDNNPHHLESFLKEHGNRQILIDEGIIIPKPPKEPKAPKSSETSVPKSPESGKNQNSVE